MRFRSATADGAVIYTVKSTGELLWWRHDGQPTGQEQWSGPAQIGVGWDRFSKVFAGGDGILYAVQPTGELFWYQDTLRNGANGLTAATGWAANSGSQIGSGWQQFAHVFSGGGGIIYAIRPTGELFFYRDLRRDGTNGPTARGWGANSGRQIGVGWNVFTHVIGGDNGAIYAVRPTGALIWYQDTLRDGSNDALGRSGWAANSGKQIGVEWDKATYVFSGPGGVIYASRCREECGELLWYRDDLRDGSNHPGGQRGWDDAVDQASRTNVVGARWELAHIEGYAWPQSAAPGETIRFHVSAPPEFPYRVDFGPLQELPAGSEIYGHAPPTYLQVELGLTVPSIKVPGRYQVSTDQAWRDGCGWVSDFLLTVPSDWSSGFYCATCTPAGGSAYQIPFIVRPPRGARKRLLAISSTNTWNAYNRWSGESNYTFADEKTLSFLRPNHHLLTGPRDHGTGNHLLRAEIWLMDFMRAAGHAVDLCCDLDWHTGAIDAEGYAAIILLAHPEYWSMAMRRRLQEAVDAGASLLYLGGNGIYRVVDYAGDGLSFQTAQSSGLGGAELFRNNGAPERALLGVAYDGNQAFSASYTVNQAQARHPLLEGVGAAFGQDGRYGNTACGWEVDDVDWTPGQSPPGTAVLASGDNGGDMVFRQATDKGFVFSVGSLAFAGGLEADPDLRTVLTNAVDQALLAPLAGQSFSDQPPRRIP